MSTSTTTTGPPLARPGPTARALLPASLVFAAVAMSLAGWSWDVQWHADVGPDTFFTAPHLFIYAGSAVGGLVALAVVLRTTAARRAGREVDPSVGGSAVGVFRGTFTAPVGYLVIGVSAAIFLGYGLWDQWWHGLYGFDARFDSPPHFGLFCGNVGMIIGVVMVLAASRDQRWARIATFATAGILIAFLPLLTDSFELLGPQVTWAALGSAVGITMVLRAVVALFRRSGAALLVALAVAVVQGLLWFFSLWATDAYAASIGALMREFATTLDIPWYPTQIPMSVLFAALLVEGAFLLGRSRGWSALVVASVGGITASAVLALLIPLQDTLLNGDPLPGLADLALTSAPTVVAALVLGGPLGFVGWRLGLVLRALAPPGPQRVAAAPSAPTQAGVTA